MPDEDEILWSTEKLLMKCGNPPDGITLDDIDEEAWDILRKKEISVGGDKCHMFSINSGERIRLAGASFPLHLSGRRGFVWYRSEKKFHSVLFLSEVCEEDDWQAQVRYDTNEIGSLSPVFDDIIIVGEGQGLKDISAINSLSSHISDIPNENKSTKEKLTTRQMKPHPLLALSTGSELAKAADNSGSGGISMHLMIRFETILLNVLCSYIY